MKNYQDFGIEIPYGRTNGQIKTLCPHCHEQRRNKRDKSLSVNLDKGVWNCHYCGWKGTIHVGERATAPIKRTYRRPTQRPMTGLSAKAINWFKSRGISERTLLKMKISEGEHFMPQVGTKMNTVQFNFFLKGELINVKYRTGNKDFTLETGAELIPYNIDSITGTSECIITEGEMDCLSFVEIGHDNCISVPNGASKNLSYLDDFIDGWFEDKQTIYIAVDTDSKGLILRDELVRRFGAERCRIVTYGDDCKDANELLMKYGREQLELSLKNAAEIKAEGVFTVSDFEDSLNSLFQRGLSKGATIGLPNFDALCSFETKRLAIITGIPGSGKSEFLDEVAERLNKRYEWRFAFFSPENAPLEYHASKLIEKITGKHFDPVNLSETEFRQAKDYMQDNFFFISPKDDFCVDSILEKAKYLVRRYGIKALVIDPYNRLDIAYTNNKETDVVRDILRKLTCFAQQNDVLVFLMAHPTKQQRNKDGIVEAPTLYDIAGSAHFFNMADYGIVIHRNRLHSNVEVKVCKVRFKHLGSVGTAYMKYNETNGRYTQYVEGETPIWDNSNHLPAPVSIIGTTKRADDVHPIHKMNNACLFNENEIKPLIPQHYDL
jgi:twinkle protein